MAEPTAPRRTSSCGVQGCLWGAVLVFVLLMVAMLVVGYFRFQEPPQGIQAPVGLAEHEVQGSKCKVRSATAAAHPRFAPCTLHFELHA